MAECAVTADKALSGVELDALNVYPSPALSGSSCLFLRSSCVPSRDAGL